MPPIRVTHSTGRYDIHVTPGIAAEAGTWIAKVLPGRRLAIITDPTIRAALTSAATWPALDADVIEVPPGEAAKSREEWVRVTDRLLALGLGRDSAIVAIGGGSVGDLAGFVAATYMRGVPVVQLPTTLLAMVDASVGGKVGLDTPAGKNLVGAFHPPALVLCDPRLLATLPDPIFREGFAEGVKHGVVADHEYFWWILANAERLKGRDPAALEQFVRRSVEIKAAIVSRDEHERGERAILNAGHTVGHALELLHRYELRHGDAVAAGLMAEARLAESLGIAATDTADKIFAVLASLELPSTQIYVRGDALIPLMQTDKKNRGGKLRMALPKEIGVMARDGEQWTIEVAAEQLLDR